jgi:microcystin-dependent protein
MVTRVDKYLGGLGIDATGKFEITDNAAAVVGNGSTTGNVFAGTINSGGVELRANDYATLLSARSNDFNTYSVVLGGLTGANTNLSGNVAIFNGAFTGSNTRLAGAESNVIALQGGLAGANTLNGTQTTNITNLTTGLTGANTNITNLTTGLTGANTNITNLTTGLTGANTAIALRALAASPTFTGNSTFDTNVLFVDSLNDRVGILTTAPGFSLDVRGTANVGALTATGTVTLGSNTNVKITGGSANQYLQTDGSGNLSYSTVQGVPTASIIMYGANTAPSGWLTCDGTAVSRTTYATLFAVVSNVFGIGDNTTTFNLPDFRGRSPYGVDASQSITIGASSAGKINVNFQTATGTGASGSTSATNTVTTSTTNSTTDKDVTNLITVVTGVTPIAHTHTIPALTVTHPAEVVQFIIKT